MQLGFFRDRSGNVAILMALLAVVVLAACGGALEFYQLSNDRTAMQEAADAAALAAVRARKLPSENREAAAAAMFARNYHQSGGGPAPTMTLSFRNEVAIVEASRTMPTRLLKFVGISDLRAEVLSEAVPAPSAPICLLALDKSLPNGFEVYGNATLKANNCAGVSNSGDDKGMRTYGDSVATAAEFGVVGRYEGVFTPLPETGIEPIPDPFSDLRIPSGGVCVDIGARLKHSSVTLDPGVYCGGIDFKAGTKVTMNPGLYVMSEGPLNVQSSSTVEAKGVTVAFTSKKSTLSLQGGAKMKITAPTDGPFAGIALFSESVATNVEWFTISGNSQLEMDGVMHLPNHEIWLKSPSGETATLDAKTSTYGLIAKRFWVQGTSKLEVTHEDPENADLAYRMRSGARLIR